MSENKYKIQQANKPKEIKRIKTTSKNKRQTKKISRMENAKIPPKRGVLRKRKLHIGFHIFDVIYLICLRQDRVPEISFRKNSQVQQRNE